MNIKELKSIIKDLPDDLELTIVFLNNQHEEKYSSVFRIERFMNKLRIFN